MKLVLACALAVAVWTGIDARQPSPSAANVIVVTLDGMRWQELFGGMSAEYLTE